MLIIFTNYPLSTDYVTRVPLIFDKALAFHQIEKSAKADDKYGQYINLGILYET